MLNGILENLGHRLLAKKLGDEGPLSTMEENGVKLDPKVLEFSNNIMCLVLVQREHR